MKTVIVASKNPVKIQAAEEGFAQMLPDDYSFGGVSVPSGVRDQPMTSAETLQGALNRARAARLVMPQADYWVGIEGGIEVYPPENLPGELSAARMAAFAWVVVITENQVGKGQTGLLFLPPRVAELVEAGKELGEADDIVFGRSNSKQENGAVGLLTGDAIDRAGFYEQAVILALAPFRNPELYESKPSTNGRSD